MDGVREDGGTGHKRRGGACYYCWAIGVEEQVCEMMQGGTGNGAII